MQLNVLARSLEPAAVVPNDAVALQVTRFDHRKVLNLDHIVAMRPTICVLEEVDDPDEFYAPALRAAGYDVVADRKSGGARDSTCVFHRREEVELRGWRVYRFGEEQSQFVLCCHFRDRRPQSSSRKNEGHAAPVEFIVVALHAKAGRSDADEAIRMEHAQRVVCEFLPDFTAACGDRIGKRVLWVGDFNAGPHSYGGRYPARVVPWLLHDAKASAPAQLEPSLPRCPIAFRSAVKEASGSHPLFTTCKLRHGAVIVQTIDYVLFADGACRCVGYLPCPSGDPATELAPLFLPNQQWGSDHLSVYCELRWL